MLQSAEAWFWTQGFVAIVDIKDHLESFRAENAKVTLAAFADVEAGMVLAASGATKPAQETLDKLCAEAQSLLGDEAQQMLAAVSDVSQSGYGLAWHGAHFHVFLASPVEPGEALILIMPAPGDPFSVLEAAHGLLATVGQGD